MYDAVLLGEWFLIYHWNVMPSFLTLPLEDEVTMVLLSVRNLSPTTTSHPWRLVFSNLVRIETQHSTL